MDPKLYDIVADLAHDLTKGAYTHKALLSICKKLAPDFGISSRELLRKVYAAYKKQSLQGASALKSG